MEHGEDRVASWKEIAHVVGVTVRTAQRWEAQRGLPVQRLAGVKGRVLASRAELTRWAAHHTHGPSLWNDPRRLRMLVVILAILLIATALVSFALAVGHRAQTGP